MTYRDFLNKLSDEDLADAIVNGTILDMACVHSNYFDSKCQDAYPTEKCIKCVKQLLQSNFDVPNPESI